MGKYNSKIFTFIQKKVSSPKLGMTQQHNHENT